MKSVRQHTPCPALPGGQFTSAFIGRHTSFCSNIPCFHVQEKRRHNQAQKEHLEVWKASPPFVSPKEREAAALSGRRAQTEHTCHVFFSFPSKLGPLFLIYFKKITPVSL
uniref:Uncharacterized protein n=1 Tax=Sphaerodactylus townsendi TaxID=933632 RepID=A0ACB8EUJ5_9SAUR